MVGFPPQFLWSPKTHHNVKNSTPSISHLSYRLIGSRNWNKVSTTQHAHAYATTQHAHAYDKVRVRFVGIVISNTRLKMSWNTVAVSIYLISFCSWCNIRRTLFPMLNFKLLVAFSGNKNIRLDGISFRLHKQSPIFRTVAFDAYFFRSVASCFCCIAALPVRKRTNKWTTP